MKPVCLDLAQGAPVSMARVGAAYGRLPAELLAAVACCEPHPVDVSISDESTDTCRYQQRNHSTYINTTHSHTTYTYTYTQHTVILPTHIHINNT